MKKIMPNENQAAVPLFGTWQRAYLVVFVAFVVEVTFFYLVSRCFL